MKLTVAKIVKVPCAKSAKITIAKSFLFARFNKWLKVFLRYPTTCKTPYFLFKSLYL